MRIHLPEVDVSDMLAARPHWGLASKINDPRRGRLKWPNVVSGDFSTCRVTLPIREGLIRMLGDRPLKR